MSPTRTEELCACLRSIVGALEHGDRQSAAEEAVKMQALIATLPARMPEAQQVEARQLLEKYAALGERLRQGTLVSMAQLGAARRLAAYGRRAYRP